MFNNMTYEEVYDRYIRPQKILAFEEGYEKGYERGKKDGYKQALEDVKNLTFRDVVYTDSLNDRTELRELIDELIK